MKRTKSMKFIKSAEAEELFLFAVSTQELYQQIQSCIKALNRKYSKGVYSHEKAVDLWYNLAQIANKLYYKWYGHNFTVTERFTCAVELEEYFYEDVTQ